jgi:GNAT superfamily N-acetyltransferase
MSALTVTTLLRRPDLLPVVADWGWREWYQRKGQTLEQAAAYYAAFRAEIGPGQTFVLLDGNVPVGTASLSRHDMDERPHLTPWLADVYVSPEMRGRGYVHHLLAAFEAACRAASVRTAWLHTHTAEQVYRKAGWRTEEIVAREGKPPATLMRKDLV